MAAEFFAAGARPGHFCKKTPGLIATINCDPNVLNTNYAECHLVMVLFSALLCRLPPVTSAFHPDRKSKAGKINSSRRQELEDWLGCGCALRVWKTVASAVCSSWSWTRCNFEGRHVIALQWAERLRICDARSLWKNGSFHGFLEDMSSLGSLQEVYMFRCSCWHN